MLLLHMTCAACNTLHLDVGTVRPVRPAGAFDNDIAVGIRFTAGPALCAQVKWKLQEARRRRERVVTCSQGLRAVHSGWEWSEGGERKSGV
jgi:hypothetical protein